jgi:urocanate hydratase
MGGAQPLAATMAGAALLGIDVDPKRIRRRVDSAYCDRMTHDLDEALDWVLGAKERGEPLSVGLVGNAAELLPEIHRRGIVPDLVTDQTSAHDPLHGYVPAGLSLEEADALREADPEDYMKRSIASMATHVQAMLDLGEAGSHVFDYGNNIRAFAQEGGVSNAFDIPGFVPAYIRPLFCEGKGPFRWVALSGDPEDIYTTDRALLELFPEDKALANWLVKAREHVAFQGLPSRICWLGYGAREKAGLLFNDLVRTGAVSAPIVIGRDHLDCGSVASPNRETEGMLDGTDGTDEADRRLSRVLRSDPGMGIVRHVDAGYEHAKGEARRHGLQIPGFE